VTPSAARAAENEPNLVDGLVQLSFLVQGVLSDVCAGVGMTLVQMRLLGILRDREPTMSELAGFLDLDKSSVTGLVDRAERRGLVRRISSTDDGRSIRVALAPHGRKLATAGTRDVGRRITALADRLSARDARQLAVLAHRFVGSGRQS
jgi:MarR family transcriptional regulator, lower aerobic nicotinate degradation pathway regulator